MCGCGGGSGVGLDCKCSFWFIASRHDTTTRVWWVPRTFLLGQRDGCYSFQMAPKNLIINLVCRSVPLYFARLVLFSLCMPTLVKNDS